MKRDVRLAKSLLLAIVISVSTATAWQVWAARKHTLVEIDTNNLNLAQALNIYADGILTQSAMLLFGVAERLQVEGSGPAHLRRLQSLVSRQEPLLNQLNGLSILDAHGDWVMHSGGSFPVGTNSADRAYFVHHRDNPSQDAFIGSPVRSQFTGDWVITISRRLEDGKGGFAGVVVVALGTENFLRAFGTLDLGDTGAISLATSGGQLLVRYPYREQDVGRDFSRSPNFLRHYVGTSGTAAFRSGLDGTQRLYAYRKSDRYPVTTIVALGKHEALRAWRQQALLTLGVVGALLAVVAAVGRRLIINIQRRVSAEASLMATREDLLQANRRLEVLATQDQLTGLANRRSFDEVLALESRRAAREGTPLSLLLFDLDYFKRFNDTYGHVAGDQCLRAVADALKQGAKRPGDWVARYGGEELAIILPNTDLPGARAVADLLLEDIRASDIPHSASPHGRVTVSVGAATLQGPQPNGAESRLIEAADRALYKAKDGGRNRSMS